jgi:hypothetical protein
VTEPPDAPDEDQRDEDDDEDNPEFDRFEALTRRLLGADESTAKARTQNSKDQESPDPS